MLRVTARIAQTLLDLAVLSAAYWLAFLLRFDFAGHLPFQMFKRLLFTWPYVVGFEYFVLSLFAVPRFAWRYVGLREAAKVLWALSVVALALFAARLVSATYQQLWPHAQYALVPIGVIAANFVLGFLGVTGIRVLRRLVAERSSSQELQKVQRGAPVPTLLLGAGRGGVMVAREIAGRPDLGIDPVGFLDDDNTKLGTIIHGVPVVGRLDDIAQRAEDLGARQALLTIANVPRTVVRRIVNLCEKAGLPTKIVPGLYELIDGKVSLSRIRSVSIEDLLGRETVALDTDRIEAFVTGKRVLVTGAGGSIGSEICRQIAPFRPAQLILVERSEFALFSIQQELVGSFPELRVTPRICDVYDADRVRSVFAGDQPHVVFHAAAHKHVPMMERNPGEALKNNVFGTKVVADAANAQGAEAFVMISTDKAVNPSSIMGATKRVAEMYIQALSGASATKFVAVRFGNVLGSTGSVIPIFKAQIASGGPVTVTHPEMKRYFMTIPEASQLVMQAAVMGKGGEIFVLDMGEPVKIVNLAHELIRLSGFTPDVDIKVEFSGARPGEKLFEEFGFDAECMEKTAHPSIYVGTLKPSALADVEAGLSQLRQHFHATSAHEVRAVLRDLVPEMIPEEQLPAVMDQGACADKVSTTRVDAPAAKPSPQLSPA